MAGYPAMIFVGLDCETVPTRPGLQAPPLACVAIGATDWQHVLHASDWLGPVVTLLENPDALIVGHNIAYDWSVLINEAPWIRPLVFDAYEQNRITDTMIRQKLCDIAGGVYRGFEDIDGATTKLAYSLEDVAQRHLGRTLDKTWTLRYGEPWARLPLEQWPAPAILYPKEDVRAAVDIHAYQESNASFLKDQYRQARAAFWIKLMGAWGIRSDQEGIRVLAERTERAYASIQADLTRAGLIWGAKVKGKPSGKPGSSNVKACMARVVSAYASIGKETPLTDGGKTGNNKRPATDKVTCQESGDPILIKYAERASLKTVLGKDIPMLRAGIHTPIHSYYEELVESGRTSSKKPNLQNQKRTGGIRECFVPRCLRCGLVASPVQLAFTKCRCGAPLTCLWSVDYGGLELCTLAQTCLTRLGQSRLAQALNDGKDPHLMIAEQILHIPYDDLKATKKRGSQPDCLASKRNEVCHCDYCTMSNARQVGKVANFGFMGGLGPAALVFFALNNYDVRLTEQEAHTLKQVWLATWPEMRLYFTWIATHTDKPFPQIEQLFSERYRGGVRFTEAANTMAQGLGADIAKAAGWLILRAMYDATRESILYGSRVVNFVHDEFVGESLITHAAECAEEVSRLMLVAAKPWLPGVSIKAEPALMWRYSKDAGPKYQDGRLVPWAA